MNKNIYFATIYLLALCILCYGCGKEDGKPQAEMPYFVVNETDTITTSTSLNIPKDCNNHLSAISPSKDAELFLSINGGQFLPFEDTIELNDSIVKISAHSLAPSLNRSAIATLNIHYSPSNLASSTIVFPNPTDAYLIVKMENELRGLVFLSILDITGLTLYEVEAAKTENLFELEIDVKNYEKGLHILRIQHGGCTVAKKVIIGS